MKYVEPSKCLFEVGQTVYCTACGEGKILAINLSDVYAIKVLFKSTRIQFYTTDGEMFLDGNRTLFFSEPEITALTEPPFKPTLEGKVVKVTGLIGEVSYIEVLRETEYAVFAHTNNTVPLKGYQTQWEKSRFVFEPIN